jgi:phosphate transport system permease protein
MNVPGGEPNAYASALVLVALLLIINGGASWTTDRWLRRSVIAC